MQINHRVLNLRNSQTFLKKILHYLALTEEIGQAGGTAGKNVSSYPHKATLHTIKESGMGKNMLSLPEKGFLKQQRTKAASAVLTIDIMTDIRQ